MSVSVPGLRYCDTARASADEIFPFQFILSAEGIPARFGYRSMKAGAMELSCSPRLGLARLVAPGGEPAAICLGVAVDAAGRRVADGVISWAAAPAADFWAGLEDFNTGLAGRYLVIGWNGGETRIYSDPSGSYPCVYDPDSGTAASSLLLALERDVRDNPDPDVQAALSGTGRMPFGNTGDARARLLAANHYLKLPAMSEHRFWPRPGDIADISGAASIGVLEKIQARLTAVTGAIAHSARALLPLSGGNDSRTLLACAKPHLGQIARCYTQTYNYNSRADNQSARLLAGAWGLPHETFAEELPFSEAEKSARAGRFEVTTGFAVQPPQTFNNNFWDQLGPDDVILQGNVLEILRASNWRTGNRAHRKLTRDFCMKRCKYIRTEGFTPEYIARWRPEFDAWHDGLPQDAQDKSFDFAFIEHYLPYHGSSLLGLPRGFTLFPFNDRMPLALSAGLPLDYRYSNAANKDLLEMTAPDLAEVPSARDLQAAKRARVQARRRRKAGTA